MTLDEIGALEVSRYYTIKYFYRGREFEQFAAFRRFEFGLYYFEDDRGDWLLLKAKNIASIS